jgi:xylulokinase
MSTTQAKGYIEQDPAQWFEAIITIVADWRDQGIRPEEIELITFSGQMQDCIPVDSEGKAVHPAILYADGRASKQATHILNRMGAEEIRRITGNHMDGTLTLPKLLWLKEEEPKVFAQTASLLIGSKDYVIRQLTGACVTDPTTAATTGMMNIKSWQWETAWLAELQLLSAQLPAICPSNKIVGHVTQKAAEQTGLLAGTPVLCGIGDAGAATLGTGAWQTGDVYAYVGTSGWMAMVTDQLQKVDEGVFHLAYLERDQYIVAPPIMNAGMVHRWVSSLFSRHTDVEKSYLELEKEMQAFNRLESLLVFLPYLNGERYPIQDSTASGIYLGIRPTTTRAEMGCAALEGVSMAMKQGMEQIAKGHSIQKLTLIGGGSKSKVWNQIFADVLGVEVQIPNDPESIPAKGAAALGFVQLGWCQELAQFFQLHQGTVNIYRPNERLCKHMEEKYRRYLQLYPSCREIFA